MKVMNDGAFQLPTAGGRMKVGRGFERLKKLAPARGLEKKIGPDPRDISKGR